MKIEHVAIWTTRLEELKTFYECYFGAQSNTKYCNELKQYESYFLTFASGARLELMQRPDILPLERTASHQHLGYTHLAFAVGSEAAVDALTVRLAADGYAYIDGPRRTGDGYYESVILDPDGNRIEITV
ncbi:MAG: VOC family protein [Caldilineaceae bacterium]